MKNKIDKKWILSITVLAFFISLLFSVISETIIPNVNVIISVIILIIVIFLGIIFDMVGVGVTVADISVFNSMASQRIKGASTGVKFIKNANKVSSFCNDVVGDVCGIISGSIGVSIAVILSNQLNLNLLLITLMLTAIVAAMTIGGKAIGKTIAINNCNKILFLFCKIIVIFDRKR